MIRKQILFADNIPDFLITRAEFLKNAGYVVLKAFTLAEARQLLEEAYVHLAILDIRMVNDDDENDVSGLSIARDPAYHAIPKIILTGKPSVSAVKEALGPNLQGLPPAVDFVDKADGPEIMIQAVDKVFAAFVKINWNLDIQWDLREPLSFPHLVNLLEPHLTSDILIYRASELEDLVRKLFFDFQHIRLGRLLWHDPQQFCLTVLTQSSDRATDLRILVCGERELLKQEQEHLKQLAPDIVQRTELRIHEETMHFGANLYGLPGANTEMIQTLRDLFQIGKERTLKAVFAHLLGEVLKSWHEHGHKVEGIGDLMSVYRQTAGLTEEAMPRIEVEKHVESLIQSVQGLGGIQIKRNDEQVTFIFPEGFSRNFPDPLKVIYAALPQYNSPVIYKISAGKLTVDNVLVDAKLQTWLTDFARIDQAPQWWDFICLEAAIHFEISQATDLPAWHEFEECLAKPGRLDEKLEETEVIPELRTSQALIEQIRQQATVETGSNPIPYYGGLLVWTVEAIANYDPGVWSTQAERLRGAHLLLTACILAERLGIVVDTSPASGPLRLDENGRVWLGEKRVASLIGLHLKLLQCLSEQAGKVVSPRVIVEKVYGEKYSNKDRDQSIRQEILRLREKIEPDPSQPRYIITEREKGYRLQVSGEPEE
jgi:DNA-binding response OmpR family regulator